MIDAAGFTRWVDERTGWATLAARLVSGRVERRGAWLRTTGFACMVLMVVLAVTGAVLGLYYAAAPMEAYHDVVSIDADRMGRFLRGLHHWGAAALLVLSGLSLARMYFGAEYKRRPVAWIATVLFAVFALLLQLTGHLLPWDTNGAATADVEAGIAGNVWLIGPFLQRFLLGGGATGGETLTRWFAFHVLLIPMALIVLVAAPLLFNRLRASRSGSEPANEVAEPSDPYYPVHMAREMTVAVVVVLIVAGTALFVKTPLQAEATAANLAGYRATAEWYVLPLHEITLIPPFNNAAIEPVATVVVPCLLLLAMFALPFTDRNPHLRITRRPAAATVGLLVILGASALGGAAVVTEKRQSEPGVERMSVGVDGAHITVDTRLAAMGKRLFAQQGCTGCHSVNGQGGMMGPDLTHAGLRHPDRNWQIQHLMNPPSRVPGSQMPSYATLKQSDLRGLAEYILSRR